MDGWMRKSWQTDFPVLENQLTTYLHPVVQYLSTVVIYTFVCYWIAFFEVFLNM